MPRENRQKLNLNAEHTNHECCQSYAGTLSAFMKNSAKENASLCVFLGQGPDNYPKDDSTLVIEPTTSIVYTYQHIYTHTHTENTHRTKAQT